MPADNLVPIGRAAGDTSAARLTDPAGPFRMRSFDRQTIQRLAEHPGMRRVFVALLALSFVAALGRARVRPFWYDEIVTVHVSSLPSLAEKWRALYDGIDSQPLAYHLFIAPFVALPLDPHVALRLPAAIGYVLALIGVYCFARWRFDRAAGVLAAILLALSPIRYYAVEARPYGMLVGSVAIAAAAWQRYGERAWALPLFVVALTFATASHHFGVVAVGCFAIAETLTIVFERRVRWPVWASLMAAAGPFVFQLPFLLNMRGMFGAHFWSPASLGQIAATYNDSFGATGIWLTVTLVFVGLASLAMTCFQAGRDAGAGPSAPRSIAVPRDAAVLKPGEVGLLVGLLLVPVWLVVPSTLAASGYVIRYSMPWLLGAIMGAVALLYQLCGRRVVFLALCPLLVISMAREGVEAARIVLGKIPDENAFQRVTRAMAAAEEGRSHELPVVVSSGIDYVPLAYYQPPATFGRYVELISPELAVRLLGTDSVDREVMLLSRITSLNLTDVGPFIQQHPAFYVYAAKGRYSWVPQYLLEKGFRLSLLHEDQWAITYLAEDRRLH